MGEGHDQEQTAPAMAYAGNKEDLFAALTWVIKIVARAVGSQCEVVLHDFSNPEKSIVAIENGHVTGRQVGDGLDELSFRLLRSDFVPDLSNYRGRTRDGRTLRSSSLLLRDKTGKPFGSVGINIDMTPMLMMKNALTEMTAIEHEEIEEAFEKNVYEVLDKYVEQATKFVGKEIPFMDKEDKTRFVRFLDEKGAFLIRYSVDRVATLLNISRYTLYSYLDESRKDTANTF